MIRHQKFIFLAGCCLAFGAAFANTAVFLETGTSVSHLTGDISRLSIDLVRTSPALQQEILRVTSAAAAFFFGAILAGFTIHHPSLDIARPYGRMIIGIGTTFMLGSLLMARHPLGAIMLSAFGCGLQNSLASKYRGSILRTTHLTGLFTDFGTALGMRIKGSDIPAWRILVPAWLIGSFFMGGVVSTMVTLWLERNTLLIAGVSYIGAGLVWTAVKHLFLQKMESSE